MRPDEHKKKKNAAYKKKHAIPNKTGANAGDENENQQDKKNKKEGTKIKGKEREPPLRAEGRGREKSEVEDDSAMSSSEDEGQVQRKRQGKEQTKKTFKKREIVSNWQKYELTPEADEKVISKGEDYQKLLNSAGSALSHFRFKDELDWEPDVEAAGDVQESQTQLFSIDSAKLADSLSCLPMHTVLGVSTDVFPAEQLASQIQAADEKMQRLSERPDATASSHQDCVVYTQSDDLPSELAKAHTPNNNLLSSTLAKPHSKIQEPLPTSPPKSKAQHNKGGEVQKGNKETNTDKQSTNSKDVAKSSVVTEQKALPEKSTAKKFDDINVEDDLDFLLSLDSPQVVADDKKKDNLEKKDVTSPSNPVINKKLTDASSTPSKKNTTSSKPKEVQKSEEGADLEDWLDSVLDS